MSLSRRVLATRLLMGVMASAGGLSMPAEAALPVERAAQVEQPFASNVKKLLEDSEHAQQADELGLALVQLKNAVRLAPKNGEIRAQLGSVLLKTGDTRTAERELRQAWMDGAPDEKVIPLILDAMVARGEIADLLGEFPEPSAGTKNLVAPDIFRARALAFQIAGRPVDANKSMDRALALRRDARNLTAKAKLATLSGDIALARRLVEEAIKLAPKSEEVRASQVALVVQSEGAAKAMPVIDEFVRRLPLSIIARVMRIEILLQLNEDVLAQAELDALLTQSPDSSFGPYYAAVLSARMKQMKDAWAVAQTLNPEFVLSRTSSAMMVAEIAFASGNVESGAAILAALVSRRPDLLTARTRLAEVQLGMGDPLSALRTLDPIKTNKAPQVQAVLGQANMQLGRFSNAIPALEKAIEGGAEGSNDVLREQLAQSAFELGDTGKAIRNLQDLEARNPKNWQILIPLIASLMQAGNLDEALVVADRMAKDAGRTPIGPFYRGRVLAAQGNLTAASAAFTEAFALDPKFTPAIYFRAHVLMAQGNYESGKNDLQQVLKQEPGNINVYTSLAQLALFEDHEAEAFAFLSNAVKVAPLDPAPRLALAALQISRSKYKEAQATLNALLRISKDNPEAKAQLGEIQYITGDTYGAIETFRALAATYVDSADVYVLLAKALNATKDRLAAIDAAKRAVELAPFSMRNRSLLIDYMIVADRKDQALAAARDYMVLHPGPQADLLVANTLVRLGRGKESYDFLAARFAAKPDRLLARQLSETAMSQGDAKKAIAVLSDWLRTNPNDFDVRLQYSSLLSQTRDDAGARKELETLLKQRPDDFLVLNNLSWNLRNDDPARALSLASQAAKIAPDSAQILDTLGWLKFQQHDVQGAIQVLRHAHELSTKDGTVAYHFAVALDAGGRRAEAKTVLQEALVKAAAFAELDDAKQLLARW